MTTDPHPTTDRGPVTTVALGHGAEKIVLRGAIGGRAVDELRSRLRAAIERGVRELFLDLSDVESVAAPVFDLVASASLELADRGGVLVVWHREDATGEATYVIADVGGRALAELTARFSIDAP